MPQRKRTEPGQDYSADLPELTPSQAKYVEGLLSGRMTDAEAYRAAYNTENMGHGTVAVEASRLKSNPKVALTISILRKHGLGALNISRDDHLQELERLKAIALETGNVGAAVQAEQLRGKVGGHYVEKHADVSQSTDVTQTLKDIAQHSPDLAAQLAAQHGIEFSAPHDETKH